MSTLLWFPDSLFPHCYSRHRKFIPIACQIQSPYLLSYSDYIIHLQIMIIILLIALHTVHSQNCSKTITTANCLITFTNDTCIFDSCLILEGDNSTASNTWATCVSSCCQYSQGNDEYPIQNCRQFCNRSVEQSMLTVIVSFSIAIPIFILLLVCLYCRCRKSLTILPFDPNLPIKRRGKQTNKTQWIDSQRWTGGQLDVSFTTKKQSISSLNIQQQLDTSIVQIICGICLQNRTNIKTCCGHLFHLKCLYEWSSRRQNCPDCRGSLDGRSLQIWCSKCLKGRLVIDEIGSNQSYLCRWCRLLQ